MQKDIYKIITVTLAVLFLVSCDSTKDNQPTTSVIQEVTNVVASKINPPPVESPSFQMSQIAEDMVTDAEVSATSKDGIDGGHAYYDKHYQTATFAGDGSGATIAIGVDLGQNTAEWTTTSWTPYFDNTIVKQLAACSGDTTSSLAKRDVTNLQNIIIVWNTALNEFNTQEVPNYYATALRVFPGLSDLSINAQSGVLATAYNRGFSMVGASRVDMRNLRTSVANKDYQGMANACLHMKITMRDSWNNAGIYEGLAARYDATAKLILTPDN